MKLNSKSGATLAAAAATLFLAGSVVSTVSTSANAARASAWPATPARARAPARAPRMPARARTPARARALGDFRKGLRRHGRQVRQRADRRIKCGEGPALPGLVVSTGGRNKFGRARVTKARPTA